MKKFVLKQKLFAFVRKYYVYDEHDQLLYEAKGKMFSLRNMVSLYDTTTQELIYTKKKKIFSFMPVHYLYDASGKEVAVMRQKLSMMKKKVSIDSDFGHLDVEGNFWALNFGIFKDDVEVTTVSKKYFQLRDTYQVEIQAKTKKDIEFYLMCVIMIDSKFHEDKNK